MGTESPINQDESQWALVMREFRKKKLPVVCGLFIILVMTVAVFAPFIANDRPIWYSGVNRSEYRESLRTVLVLLNDMVDEKSAPELTAIDVHIERMSEYLPEDKASLLADIHAEVIKKSSSISSADSKKSIREARIALRRSFSDSAVNLVDRSHWPVPTSLNGLDLTFMTLVVVLLSSPIWVRVSRAVLVRRNRQTNFALAVVLVLPVVVGFGWHLAVPETLDRTNYKSGVLAEDEGELKRPTVVYSSVMWPPIRYGLDENNIAMNYRPPIHREDDRPRDLSKQSQWNQANILGTDRLGRDLLCRMIWGGRVSLSVGVVAVSIYVTIGIIIGSIAGYFRGWVDLIISRIIEIVICFPSFFLILTIVAFLGPSIFNIMLVIGLIGWTGVARLVRGEFLRLSEQEFVLAGRSLGYSAPRLIFRHILPNALAPVLVSATFGVAGAILTESALSFLGLGITVPKPSWGGILSDGRSSQSAVWLSLYPGLAIFLTITAYNLVAEALRDAADPRLRGAK